MGDKKREIDESYVDILKSAQDKLSGIILPSMGLLNNEVRVKVEGSEFLNQKKVGKEN